MRSLRQGGAGVTAFRMPRATECRRCAKSLSECQCKEPLANPVAERAAAIRAFAAKNPDVLRQDLEKIFRCGGRAIAAALKDS